MVCLKNLLFLLLLAITVTFFEIRWSKCKSKTAKVADFLLLGGTWKGPLDGSFERKEAASFVNV